MDERVYWIWAQQAFKPGSARPAELNVQYPGGLREFCEGGPKLWNSRRDLKNSEAAALRDFSLGEAEARLEYAEKVGWHVLTPACGKYPELLKNIPNPPAVLYWKGDLPDVDAALSVAVVGARRPLPAVADAARRFGYQLAAGGACLVSGGAVGVDAEVLLGAMQIPDSRMICVLPVSLDSSYIVENARLRAMICERGGALVSEYFSQQNPDHGTFPARNRVITGLSRGVVILQSRGKGSGGMLYAASALEQNRDVFVYPPPEGEDGFEGNRILLEEGALTASCGEDVLAEYEGIALARKAPDPRVRELLDDLLSFPAAPEEDAAALADPGASLSPEARRVWEALGREPLSVGQLEERTGLPAASLLGLLTGLELDGLVRSLPGKRYVRGGGV